MPKSITVYYLPVMGGSKPDRKKCLVAKFMKNFALWFLLASLLIISVKTYSQQALIDSPVRHKVLIIFDSDTFTPWKRGFVRGLESYLDEFQRDTEPVRLAYEFLGEVGNNSGDESDWYLDALKNKQKSNPAEIVVTVLPLVSEFIYEKSEELYPGVEILYAVPNTRIEEDIRNSSENIQFLPSASKKAFENTIKLIPELLPDLENLYVVSGTNYSDGQYLADSQPFLDSLPDRIQVNSLVGHPTRDLQNLIFSTPPNSAVYMLSIQDEDYMTIDQLNVLFEESSVPIFTVFDSSFVDNIVGGNYTNSTLYGRSTAEILLQMLYDEPAPAVASPPTEYRFNQPQLRRWGIDEDLLPPGSIVENQQVTFLSRYSQQLLIFLLMVGALLASIVFRAQRKNAAIEQRRLQEELAQAQKLEGLGNLSAGIAHEINTPCQYVSDNMTFMDDAIVKMEPFLHEVRKFLEQEHDSGDPLGTIDIEQLQKLYETADVEYLLEEASAAIGQSKSGMERIKLIVLAMKAFSHPGDARVALDLNEAISNTLIVATNEWKNVAKIVTNYDRTLAKVDCIPSAINQAILNIVINATHAIGDVVRDGEKGEIRVSTSVKGNDVIIKISDTGPGMPADIRSKIFDPFFTTKEVGKGTGQGLAIAHKIICIEHNGTIEVDSVPGEGACFTICLPVTRAVTDNTIGEIEERAA